MVSYPLCVSCIWRGILFHQFYGIQRVCETNHGGVHTIYFFSLTFLNHIRDIKDPEHPYSLEELKVITEDAIEVDDELSYVR